MCSVVPVIESVLVSAVTCTGVTGTVVLFGISTPTFLPSDSVNLRPPDLGNANGFDGSRRGNSACQNCKSLGYCGVETDR